MKCKYLHSTKGRVWYHFFFIRYQKQNKQENKTYCNIKQCSFQTEIFEDEKDEVLTAEYLSEIPCPDEKVEPSFFNDDDPTPDADCRKELRLRGWDKYVPEPIKIKIDIKPKNKTDNSPRKFKNPIFNNTLWTGNPKLANDIYLTPTHIYDKRSPNSDELCEYITEDEKGVLLKCKYLDSEDEVDWYHFLFIRYKWEDTQKNITQCNVEQCIFYPRPFPGEPDGKVFSNAFSSDIPCLDEKTKVYTIRNNPTPTPDCREELHLRGWDKYIPKPKKSDFPSFSDF